MFFFQAEDGIRDIGVTGVQTCALPICVPALPPVALHLADGHAEDVDLLQRVLHRVEQVRPDDGFDFFHPCLLKGCVGAWAAAPSPPCKSCCVMAASATLMAGSVSFAPPESVT